MGYRSEVRVAEIVDWRNKIAQEIERVFWGRPEAVDYLLVALLCEGHVLLEDIPGVGKTLLAKAFARTLSGNFQRIQGTPDLMPADILGFSLYSPKTGEFEFKTGPVMTNVLLVDEINRCGPRTQAALLQAMGEGEVTQGGQAVQLPDPFMVIATENPVEFEGTFPLPEAQKDRFLLCFSLGYPTRNQEERILVENPSNRGALEAVKPVSRIEVVQKARLAVEKVFVDPKLLSYALDLAQGTREHPSLALGLSPRGVKAWFRASRALALVRGRNFLLPEDLKELFLPAGIKRVIVKSAAQIRGATAEDVLREVLEKVPTPALKDGS